VLREQFIANTAYIKINQRSQVNNLMMHLNLLEKQEQANSKAVDGKK
jgi:hypothetical protein